MGLKIDLNIVMRIVALICCAIAIGINVDMTTSALTPRAHLVSNSFIYSVGAYIIILGFFLFWTIIQGQVDKTFAAIVLICGCLWTIGAGIGVIVFYVDYGNWMVHELQLVAGILALVAGCVMLADGLHNIGVF